MTAPLARYQLLSPAPTGRGAIAAIGLRGDIDAALDRLGIAPVGPGRAALRSLARVDEGVVARWADDHATLMPHAGPAVVGAILRALEDAGVAPEPIHGMRLATASCTLLESRMLAALARAASPLAIDLLLDQPGRWAGVDTTLQRTPGESARDARLGHLIDPPLVVALGPPNIGKSTLLNTLAGRSVAIVADEPGTTRDHVGVALDLAGLVVRYLDTPGMAPAGTQTAIDAEAQRLAFTAAAGADLILLCADATSQVVAPPHGPVALRLALRTDLGAPAGEFDARVCAQSGEGIADLVSLLRETLVPAADMCSRAPWRFWGEAD